MAFVLTSDSEWLPGLTTLMLRRRTVICCHHTFCIITILMWPVAALSAENSSMQAGGASESMGAVSTKPSQGLGQLVVQDAQSASPVRLNVARYHAHVVLQPPVALVQIDQSFYNPYGRQEEGTFVFSLPLGASVSRFAMYVAPGQLVEGELVERQQAASIYQSIVTRRRDPAILEQIGDNLFKMRVFPIPPNDSKRILLDYTVPLESSGGACSFRLPMFSDLEPIWDFRVSGVIGTAVRPEGAASPSHPDVAFQRHEDGTTRFEFVRQNYQPKSDFLLNFAEQPDPQVSLRSYTAEPLPAPRENRQSATTDPWFGRRAMYFQVSIPHAAGLAEGFAPGKVAAPPADVLVLADTSSSMRGCQLLRQTVGEIMHKLRPADRFRLVCVDVAARPLGGEWLPGGGTEVETALKQFDQQFSMGGTNLDAAFPEALALFEADSPRRRLVVYVGDGEQSDAGPNVDAFRKRLADRLQELHAALLGVLVRHSNEGRRLFDSLARAGGGLVFDLAGSALGQRDLAAWLSAGLPSPEKIVQIEIEGAQPEDLYCPTAWLPDRTLHIFGRISPREKLRLTLTSIRDGKPVTQQRELTVAPNQDDVFVGRLWAQRKLDQLCWQEPAPDPQRPVHSPQEQQTITLSQEWSLLSPYTAFLVLESEQEYVTWGIDRRQRHRYWKPTDAQPQKPISEEWVQNAARRVGWKSNESEEQRFSQVIRSVRTAIGGGHPSLADRLLDDIRTSPLAAQSPEFAELSRQAKAGIRRATLLRAIHAYRALFDPAASEQETPVLADVLSQLAAKPTTDPDFLRRHPYAGPLLKEVTIGGIAHAARPPRSDGQETKPDTKSVDALFNPATPVEGPLQDVRTALQAEIVRQQPPRGAARRRLAGPVATGDFTLADLTAVLASDPSINVVVDRQALDDLGIDNDTTLSGFGYGRMSLRGYARFLLRQDGLTLLEEPHRLLITTAEDAESRLTTEVYPVADLLLTDHLASRSLLVDPYLDRQVAAEERLRGKLQRPMSVEFSQTPLYDVVKQLAGLLDDTVLVDEKALEDAGRGLDTPITAHWREVPAKDSLRWILRDVGLTYTVSGEALVITTPEEAGNHTQTRLHSGRGVVYEYAAPPGGEPRRNRDAALSGMAMGGMGGGGMWGGSFGGASGGMGGGGFGGSDGRAVSRSDSTAVGISSGGEATLRPQAAESEPASPPSDHPAGQRSTAPTSLSPNERSEPQYTYDVDTPIDMISTTISPTTWDSVGGPGSIALFEPTLDFVVSTTEDVHEQIDILFDRLRKLPPLSASQRGWRPATVHPVNPDSPLDFDSVIDLIQTTVCPTSWDTVGGPGSITVDEPRAALILSQTQDVQDALSNLLTMLRRSRYDALRSDRPWNRVTSGMDQPLIAPWAAAESSPLQLSAMPEPKPEELGVLSSRHVPESGLWEWRRTKSDGTGSETLVLRRQAGRLEIRLPDRVLRADGDGAAIAWPRLGLVELGNWGEGVRQVADRWLPWLPHRTNDELARLFCVAKSDAGRARLMPTGLPTSANSWVEAEFAGQTGLPHVWQSQLDGKLTGRLRVEGSAGQPMVVMEDGDGKVASRWELVRFEADNVEAPPLDAEWPGLVRLDRRSQEPSVDWSVGKALEAIGKSDWSNASDNLREAMKTRPRHPLLLLLAAWCCEHDPRLGSREEMVTVLKDMARQGLSLLARGVNEDNFPSLSAVQRYEVLSCLPVEIVTAADRDCLAQAAAKAGRLNESLAHAQAALQSGNGDRQFERHCAVVELLLRLERANEAVETAQRWAAAPHIAPEQLAAMAELLAKHGSQSTADALFIRSLAGKELTPQERFGLICRRAALCQAERRWQLLLEAAETMPADSAGRHQCLAMIVAELVEPRQAEVAAQLAGRTQDPELKSALMLKQAELSAGPEDQAEIYWQLFEASRLADKCFDSACSAWIRAQQPQRVIEAVERWLRCGKRLSPQAELQELAIAYRLVGREADARRAASNDPEPPENRKSPSGRNRRDLGTGMF